MITYTLLVLDFLVAGILFWPISFVFGLWAYIVLRDDKDFPFSPLFLLTIIYAMVAYHFKWFTWLADWHNICYAIAGYLIAGMIVAFTKWTILVVNFRRAVKSDSYSRRDYRYTETDKGLMLDWNSYSVSSWVTYWPFHSLFCIFEPTRLFIKWLTQLFKGFFVSIAELGAIKK